MSEILKARVPFNKYEAVLLLESYLHTINDGFSKKEAIAECSKKLRQMALNSDTKIDDSFRSISGITYQMSCMESAYCGHTIISPASHLFKEVVSLFESDNETYRKVLKEAEHMAASNNKAEEESFYTWLESSTSMPYSAIKSSVGSIEILLIKNGVIQKQIKALSPDESEKALRKLKGGNSNIHSKKLRKRAIEVLSAYKDFLNSFLPREEEESGQGTSFISTVSFVHMQSYAYTKPVDIMFQDFVYPVNNWTELYVRAVKCLFSSYPDIIESLEGENISGSGRMDIASTALSTKVVSPKEISDDLFLETNLSASVIVSKIKQMMDLCHATYDTIVIHYVSRGESSGSAASNTVSAKRKPSENNFYHWLIEEGLAKPTARSYSSAINNCDAFCKAHQIGTGTISKVNSSDEIKSNIRLLIEDSSFQEYNDRQHHRFTAALKKYATFLKGNGVASAASQDRESEDVEAIDSKERFYIRNTLMQPRFEYGFKDDIVELSRFRELYTQVNGVECALSDEKLSNAIRKIGFNFNGKVYLIDDKAKASILSELEKYRSQGITIIYYDLLFNKDFELYDAAKVTSYEMLKALLEVLAPDNRYKGSYFTFSQERATEIEWIKREIIRVWVWGSSTLQTFDELAIKLPLIPLDKIKHVLAQQSEFIWNSHETYLRRDQLHFPEDDVKVILKYIDNAISANGRVTFEELPLAEICDRNPEVSESALNNTLYKLIEDKYDRNDKVLTKKGDRKDTYAAVVDYCCGKEKCTYSELEKIGQKVAGSIRRPKIVEAANASMIRISNNLFVKDSLVSFDVDRIDRAIGAIVTSDFIGMREVTTFVTFPFCGYAWNLYLLESYCRRFSKKYKYETRLSNSSNSGAIVSKDCHLSYHDIMVHAVARSKWDLTVNGVYDFLTYAGYIERKRYSEIDTLIKQAAELRERRE